MGQRLGLLCVLIAALVVSLTSAVLAQNCCIEISPGTAHPPDHTWQYDPVNPDAPNLMMHAKLCLVNCPAPPPTVMLTGVELRSGGTGNDAADINWIRVTVDANCNGIIDAGDVLIAQTTGGYPIDNGSLPICNPSLNFQLTPNNCVCLLIEYNLKPTAPCNATYFFWLAQVLTGTACQPYPLCGTNPLMSATKTVVCDGCCLDVTYGPAHPADHDYTCGAANPLNLMQHLKICNQCPDGTSQTITGLVLQAGGTGNDQTGIQQVEVYRDADCDGKPDGANPVLTGSYPADDGTLSMCATGGGFTLQPGQCVCLLIYYKMSCPPPPPPGTYYFSVTNILGPNCQPICANPLPIKSCVKTVPECCPVIGKGPHFPADHDFICDPAVPNQPNYMAEFRLCNPCQTDLCINGLRLVAGGTGNDQTGIQNVLVSLDWNCDGVAESINVLSGTYPSDDGTLDLCDTTGFLCLAPGQCVCIQVYYQMDCNAPAGTYYFDLTALLGPNCQPLPCVNSLPIHSATKHVSQQPCCLDVAYGPTHPADHNFNCPPIGADAPMNKMMNVMVCNPCPQNTPIFGFTLQAFGTGNDLTGIAGVFVAPDLNCDGIDDSAPVPMGTYPADNGTLTYCQASGPIAVLAPYQCGCFNIYYKMKCPNPVLGTYLFTLNAILGPNCQPLCVLPGLLPMKSAVKTIDPQPCCLDVTIGPKNPPNHNWWPGLPIRNKMFQYKICNPCPDPARITCFKLTASGTGNDQNDLYGIRIFEDTNCDGVQNPGEPTFGIGAYPANDGTATINGFSTIMPGQCKCYMVEYIMKPYPMPKPPLGATYCMTLASVCATNTATGAAFCVKGLPIKSNCKKRCIKIGQIPWFPNGIILCLAHKVVTANFPDRFYVQDLYADTRDGDEDGYGPSPDRSAGIAVLGSLPAAASSTGGVIVDIEGVAETVNCEVVIRPTSIEIVPEDAPEVKPVGMNNRNTGGGKKGNQPPVVDSFFDVFFSPETNNIGLLVTTWGRVTDSDGSSACWVDDGKGLKDGTFTVWGDPHVGMKVNTSYAGWAPPVGSYVAVTGIMRAENNRGMCIRVLYPRARTDIRIVPR